MDIIKKILVIALSLGILGALFFIGAAFFVVALFLLPVLYLYQRYKMDNLWGKVAAAKRQKKQESEGKTIEAEYEVIEEEKK